MEDSESVDFGRLPAYVSVRAVIVALLLSPTGKTPNSERSDDVSRLRGGLLSTLAADSELRRGLVDLVRDWLLLLLAIFSATSSATVL